MRISDWSSDVCSSDLYLLTALDAMDPHLLTAVVFLNGIVIGFNQPSRLALVPSLVPPEHLSTAVRSEERRVGKECVSTCRSRCSQYHYKKKIKSITASNNNR